MAGSRKAGTERYNPLPHQSPRYRDVITMGQYRRGPADLTWSVLLTMPDGSKVGPLSAGKGGLVEASEKAAELYLERKTLHQRGISAKPATMERLPALPCFATAANLAVARLSETYTATLKKEGRGKANKSNAIRANINSVLLPAFELVTWPDMPSAARKWLPTYRLLSGEKPSQGRVGNLNHALQYVCDVAVEQGWLPDDPAMRPRLGKKGFRQPQQEPAFTEQDILGMAWAFNDVWVWGEKNRDRLYFRAWVALMASAGLRAGLEVEMTLENQIEITSDGIFIYVGRNKGKYKNARTAVCRGPYFQVESILNELFEYRRMYWKADAPIDQCGIFADPTTGKVPDKFFHRLFQRYMKEYGWLIDKSTGQNRVPYSFRHFFITQAILDSVDLPFIAIIAGTSVNMINKYYTHVTSKQAALKVSDISKVIGGNKLMNRQTRQLDGKEQDRLAKLGVF